MSRDQLSAAGGVWRRGPAIALAALALAGCATVSPDGGQSAVQALTAPHLAAPVRVARSEADLLAWQPQVQALLQQELTPDAAVQVALLSQRGLQARLAEVGITEAEIAQASRWPNPGLTLERTRRGDERETDRSLHVNLARLLMRPWTRELDQRRLQQVQQQAAAQVLALAADVRRAWVQAVAAEQSLVYAQQVHEAAEAAAELARRMAAAGNFNALQQAREQGFAAEAALGLARASHQRTATRERLTRLMGLWGEQAAFRLPTRLPELPTAARELPDVERQAIAQRLDVRAAVQAAEATARSLGLARANGLVNVLELGVIRNTNNEAPVQRGVELSLELPLFDWGGARVARAEAIYRQALHQAAHTAIEARSEVREAYAAYRTAWDIAQHQFSTIVPLRQRIAQENLLRYNGMLIGVFELLADARGQIASVNGAIDSLRDFWLAQADLDQALLGKPALMPLPSGPSGSAAAAADPH
jgi:outer membrane protein TolC